MIVRNDRPEPKWAGRFLTALREGASVRAAARAAGICNGTAYHRRRHNEAFAEAWEACAPVDGRSEPQPEREKRKTPARINRFLALLAETSNVSAAAQEASLSTSAIYKLRREDPEFARRWYAALAEGYDNLEMELLGRLRAGESAEETAKPKGRFDTAAALRCLTAHRESVAREKGRRTLAAEVATIAAINARIDEMRARRKRGERAIRDARENAAARGCKAPASARGQADGAA